MIDFNINDVDKPYTYELTSRFHSLFTIFFEGAAIKTVARAHPEDMKSIVDLLNTAYQLGYSSGYIAGTIQYSNELKKVA